METVKTHEIKSRAITSVFVFRVADLITHRNQDSVPYLECNERLFYYKLPLVGCNRFSAVCEKFLKPNTGHYTAQIFLVC